MRTLFITFATTILVLCCPIAGAGERFSAFEQDINASTCDATGMWSADLQGLTDTVEDLLEWNGTLVALAGGVVRVWNGSQWLAEGPNGVRAIVVYNGDLIAAGIFEEVDGIVVNSIARWDGASWHALGNGLLNNWFGTVGRGEVLDVIVFEGDLIAIGEFGYDIHPSEAQGTPSGGLGRWDGATWHEMDGFALDRPFEGTDPIRALTLFDGQLVATVRAETLNEDFVRGEVALWDGNGWTELGETNGAAAVVGYQGTLYAFSLFVGPENSPSQEVHHAFARWTGTAWEPRGVPGANLAVEPVQAPSKPAARFGRWFVFLGNTIRLWDTKCVMTIGSVAGGGARAGVEFQGGFYIGGNFDSVEQVPASRIARWDGTITPITVSEFDAAFVAGHVQLRWNLTGDVLGEATHVAIQRSRRNEGPWTEIGRLAPAESMQFVDSQLKPGSTYWYRLALQARDGSVVLSRAVEARTHTRARRNVLYAASETTDGLVELRYRIANESITRIEIFDVLGRRVDTLLEGVRYPGDYATTWDRLDATGRRIARGIYVVRLVAGKDTPALKIALVR